MKKTLRDYQQEPFDKSIAHFKSERAALPVLVDMSVGSGKTALAAFIAAHVAGKGGKVMLLARQGELVDQDGAFAESIGVKVSYFSASLGAKSTRQNVIMGTEGTVVRALNKELAAWCPDLLMIDECHQVDYDREDSMFMRIIRHMQATNPKLRILGLTGSPYRGSESIIGPFWQECLHSVSTDYLISQGWLVQPHFGWPEHEEDSFDFSALEQELGTLDFTEEQLDKLRMGDPTLTERIMAEVVARTKDDLGVLIFAQSKKHTKEVAGALPPGSWAIITDDTPEAERREALEKAKTGAIKYTINIGVLTTGVDVPYWQSVVYLRPVGSLVLLIQSIGRVLRLLIENGADMNALDVEGRLAEIAASRKPCARVYDYAGVMDRLGEMYENGILEQAQLERSQSKREVIECPRCGAENSSKARRCIGRDHKGERCDHFWVSVNCRECGAQNDPTARDCRCCGAQIIDPNAKLLNKAYTDTELVLVKQMLMQPVKNGGLLVKFVLDCEEPSHGWPVEFYSPGGSETARRIWYNNFVKHHVRDSKWQSKVWGIRTAEGICKMAAMFDQPTHIAYRINQNGKFVIGRRKFSSGREVGK